MFLSLFFIWNIYLSLSLLYIYCNMYFISETIFEHLFTDNFCDNFFSHTYNIFYFISLLFWFPCKYLFFLCKL
ncbi:hypothetical protein MtrunA17_Chr5g0446241 [Medicago truncatula]|uniref:Transmembrane protein n=1 Tax=Medicago truncatula TaxID=3880 RepID=A0A396HZI8_MEDTR|nr:hypothetical protein MtrunA17_Chr5g0446241 [Medicago truncatula]